MISPFFNFHHHNRKENCGIYNFSEPEEMPSSLFSVGIHPAEAGKFDEKWGKIQEFAKNPNCIAIGECGLDALVHVEKRVQEKVFSEHISLANSLKKPLIIHCVRRFNEIISFRKLSDVPMIVHGLNKKENIAKDLLKHNFYLSFGSALLQNVSLQETFSRIPENRYFLETDNSPANIADIYKVAAGLRNCTTAEIRAQITVNLQTITNGQKLA